MLATLAAATNASACWLAWLARLACQAAGPVLALVHALLLPLDRWPRAAAAWAVDEEAVPLLGSLPGALLGRRSLCEEVAALYGRHPGRAAVGAFGWRGRPYVLVRCPRLAARVLADLAGPDGTDARLAAAQRAVRGRLSPLLIAGRVDATARLMADCAEQLLQALQERAEAAGPNGVEVLEPLGRYCTAVVGSCAFGVAGNCVQDPGWELHRVARAAVTPSPLSMLALALVTALPASVPLVPARLLFPAAARFYVDMLAETPAFRARTRTRRKDFVELMTAAGRASCATASLLADKDRRRHCALAFDVVAAEEYALAAHRHAPRAAAACLLGLAGQPGLQHQLAQQLRRAPHGGTALQVMQEAPLLEQVVLEAVRLHPPCEVVAVEVQGTGYSLTLRGADADADMKANKQANTLAAAGAAGPELRPGTRLLVPVMALHRDPSLHPEPLLFDPDRFAPVRRRALPPGAFLPFGELPAGLDADLPSQAQSTGARFTLQALCLAVAALVTDLEFDVVPGTPSVSCELPDEVRLLVRRRRSGKGVSLTSSLEKTAISHFEKPPTESTTPE